MAAGGIRSASPVQHKVQRAEARQAALDQDDTQYSGNKQPQWVNVEAECRPACNHCSDNPIVNPSY